MTDDERPSIAEMKGQADVSAAYLALLIEIAATALAYRRTHKAAAGMRAAYYAEFDPALSPDVEAHDKEELRCRTAYEAALSKVRE